MMLITGIANANPNLTLRDIAIQLEAMHERRRTGRPRRSRIYSTGLENSALSRSKLPPSRRA
jgi:hypothetical protein